MHALICASTATLTSKAMQLDQNGYMIAMTQELETMNVGSLLPTNFGWWLAILATKVPWLL